MMMRENEIVLRDRFFRSELYNLSLCSSIDSKRVVVRGNARGEERQLDTRETHTQKEREREREREREKKKENNNAPVYCSTSDFTHPFNPSSNVSKNAAPSTSRLAFALDDANAATVVAHAIVFFKPPPPYFLCDDNALLLLLFLPRLLPFVVFAMMIDEMMCRFSQRVEKAKKVPKKKGASISE